MKVSPAGITLSYVGLENFRYALRVDPDFTRVFTETTIQILISIPAVIIFSLFTAILLNQKFGPRVCPRDFLPAGNYGVRDCLRTRIRDLAHQLMALVSEDEELLSASQTLMRILMRLRLPAGFTGYIITAVSAIRISSTRQPSPFLSFVWTAGHPSAL